MNSTLRVTKTKEDFYITIGQGASFGAPFKSEDEARAVCIWLQTAMPKIINRLAQAPAPKKGEEEAPAATLEEKPVGWHYGR